MGKAVIGALDACVCDETAGVARGAGRRATELADLKLHPAGDPVQIQFAARHGPIAALELDVLGVEAHLRVALHVEPIGRAQPVIPVRVMAVHCSHLDADVHAACRTVPIEHELAAEIGKASADPGRAEIADVEGNPGIDRIKAIHVCGLSAQQAQRQQ
jgi:hypothetical protein